MDLSVILPVFRAALTAQTSVEALINRFEQIPDLAWEVIVVDDGGHDFPEDFYVHDPRVRVIRHPLNQGKGAAVVSGLRAATGSSQVYTDVDLPYGIEPLLVAHSYIRSGFHVVLGDRTLVGSDYRLQLGIGRKLLSSTSAFVAGTLVTGGIFDTQCGLKGFSRDVASVLADLIQVKRFAFDLEVTYLILRHNCIVRRIPVRFGSSLDESTVRPFRDGLRAIWDMGRIKWAAVTGLYDSAEMQKLIDDELARRASDVVKYPGPTARSRALDSDEVHRGH